MVVLPTPGRHSRQMEVRWHGPDDVATFAELAWPLLDTDPVRHTLALTTLHGLTHPASSRAAGAMVTVHDGARTVGALVCSAGRPAIVSAVRADQAAAVDRLLATADPALPGAIGPVREVEAFVAEHTARSGASVRVDRRMRLFVLDELAAPKGVAGTARTATPDDMDLIDDWIDEFRIETSQQRDPVPPRNRVRPAVDPDHARWIWEVGGEPVALAVARSPLAGMSRIGPVFTPVRHREHGYGAAVTSAASRWAIDAGATHVVLFTDLSNPTTNRLYPRIGYRPAHDEVEIDFLPAAGPTTASGAP